MNSAILSNFFASIGISFLFGLVVIGAGVGFALHRYSPPRRRTWERKAFSSGYGLVWGAAASVLTVLVMDSTAQSSEKIPPLQFLEILVLGALLCGLTAFTVSAICSVIAWKLQKPMGRPMVDFSTVGNPARRPGVITQKNSRIVEKSGSF
jgi:hypothetical protein